MRKPFDDATGKHVAKEPSPAITLDEIMESLVNVLGVVCPRCEAKAGDPCTTLVGTRGDRQYPHPERTALARSNA